MVSNYSPDNPNSPFNEISVNASTIFIIGFNNDGKQVDIPIKHDCRHWTTLYIDWLVEEDRTLSGSYMIDNNKKLGGIFNFKLDFVSGDYIDVGCRAGADSRSFTGSVSALELYTSWEGERSIPLALRSLVIESQMVDEELSSPAKKKKYIYNDYK